MANQALLRLLLHARLCQECRKRLNMISACMGKVKIEQHAPKPWWRRMLG